MSFCKLARTYLDDVRKRFPLRVGWDKRACERRPTAIGADGRPALVPLACPTLQIRQQCLILLAALLSATAARADEPAVSYIFPAGGQRGTTVDFRVGGMYLHEGAALEMLGAGVSASPRISPVETIWFEGPIVPLPASQQKEDYPKDYAGNVAIAGDAPLGLRYWRVATSQGATPSLKFVVGDLPELVEHEIDGEPLPVAVSLPVTVNGRIFPREDVDEWAFTARQGEVICAETMSARLGYPLRPRLVLLDAASHTVAEDFNTALLDGDACLSATIPADGEYRVRIHDVKFSGLQDYVYRLTLTKGPRVDRVYPLGGRRGEKLALELAGPGVVGEKTELTVPTDAPECFVTPIETPICSRILLATDDLPEVLEAEPNDSPGQAPLVALPVVCNGRIGALGDKDAWAFNLRQGEAVQFEVRATRFGSPLDSVLVVLDTEGREVARADDQPNNQTDARLKFAAPQDGKYVVRVEDRFASRGGPAFAYRLHAAPPKPDFRLALAADALTVYRGAGAKLRVTAERLGYDGPIKLAVEGLPPGVLVAETEIRADQPHVDLAFRTDSTAKIGTAKLRIVGTAEIGGQVRTAMLPTPRGEIPVDTVLLAVAMPTPFKVVGTYDVTFVPRGSVLKRRYTIERNGYTGPLELQLADRQARHLQGVSGSKLIVPPEADSCNYEVYLPPWMELGRTSRSVVMAVGVVTDADGSRHTVSFSSQNQNEQIVALVGPGELSLQSERASFVARPGGTVEVPLRVLRSKNLTGPVKLELIVPPHIHGITAESVVAHSDAERSVLRLNFAQEFGPLHMPLLVRATLAAADGPIVAETKIELTAP